MCSYSIAFSVITVVNLKASNTVCIVNKYLQDQIMGLLYFEWDNDFMGEYIKNMP